ncbi:hypothetical protein PAS25_21835 [Leclercia adecarboxylata]|uniref:hypothetical protein n=1 Tax=Leclercia adecarboxylata TaxID=83655 RepID=UPI00111867D9|nr:hypothetical protein [Leclercia adecarboxylata]QCZ25485.1 hypothetical protein FHN83_01935 [Leclercia adecarboxylata]
MDLLQSLRAKIISYKERKFIKALIEELPDVWLSVTKETSTVRVSNPGFIRPEEYPRAVVSDAKDKNNKIYFLFTFVIGDVDMECAEFLVPMCYEKVGNVVYAYIGESSEHLVVDAANYEEIVRHIVNYAENQ